MARLQYLLFVLWIGVTLGSVVDLQKRIIGGQPCNNNERLYHVEVRAYYPNRSFTFCGGSLIHPRWVLTAQHCWNASRTMRAILGVHPGPGTEVDVTPEFFTDNQNRIHDIMLLRIPNPTQITPVPRPDCQHRPAIGDSVEIAGHGATTGTATGQRQPGRSNTLQCAQTTVVPRPAGQQSFQHLFFAQRPGVDACLGDSGGGVVYNNMIYGVISFTCDGLRVCRAPLGFMDVCSYLPWINQRIGP